MFLDATYSVEHKTVHCVHKTLVKRHDKKILACISSVALQSWFKLAQLSFWLERNVLADLLYTDAFFFYSMFQHSSETAPLLVLSDPKKHIS